MEEQAGYVTEALDLLHGEPSLVIEPERTIIERRGGEFKETVVPAFVKISTSFKGELVNISDAALKVWIFIALSVNRKTGTAHPGLRTIAAALGKGVNTIRECIEELEEAKLLQVDRKSKKYNIYEPLGYVSANRSDPVSGSDTVEESVSENSQTVSKNPETVSVSGILNQRNQKEPDLLDAILENERTITGMNSWEGRETFRPDHYPLVDWYHNTTGQVCSKSHQKDWHKAVMMWTSNGLAVDDLQNAYDMDIQWRKVFTSPNQLTEKAVALKAQRKTNVIEVKRTMPKFDENGRVING